MDPDSCKHEIGLCCEVEDRTRVVKSVDTFSRDNQVGSLNQDLNLYRNMKREESFYDSEPRSFLPDLKAITFQAKPSSRKREHVLARQAGRLALQRQACGQAGRQAGFASRRSPRACSSKPGRLEGAFPGHLRPRGRRFLPSREGYRISYHLPREDVMIFATPAPAVSFHLPSKECSEHDWFYFSH